MIEIYLHMCVYIISVHVTSAAKYPLGLPPKGGRYF